MAVRPSAPIRKARRRIRAYKVIMMRTTRSVSAIHALTLAALLAACDTRDAATAGNGVTQTTFPGQVTAGGNTSGEVLARGGVPHQAGSAAGTSHSGQEGVRGQSPGGTGASGTPSIPEGAGGTPSGASMGGTTPGAAASQTAPAPGGASPSTVTSQSAEEKKAQAAAQAEKEKQELSASMDKIAAYWRSRAAANRWEAHAPTAIGAPAAGTTSAPLIRSEKSGTAAPSEDVKDPAKKGK